MPQSRSLFVHGLGLTLRRFPVVLWAFTFNFVYAAITTARLSSAIGSLTDTSLAARPLDHGFDLSILAALGFKIYQGPGLRPSFASSIVLYGVTYFLLVPGALLCYQTGAPARLSTLLQAGLLHFWRFVRITILTLLTMGVVLGVLLALWSKVANRIDSTLVGRPAFLAELSGYLVIALIAAVLRLYFDLVEVYTVQLGLHRRPNGKPDRRVRKTLGPALRALGHHFGRAYLTFLLLAALGFAAVIVTARISMHSLAQPRVWPLFLLSQAGLFLMLFTRFWQRGAETVLSLDHPIIEKPIQRTTFVPAEPVYSQPPPPPVPFAPPIPHPPTATVPASLIDPIPAPEPPTPSLAEPDPAVYHHDVAPRSDPDSPV